MPTTPLRKVLALSLQALLSCLAPPVAFADLQLGSVAADIPAVMHQRLKPLADYLARELGEPVTLRLAPDLKRAAEEVASGQVDISYLTPVAYLRAHSAGKVRLVAKVVTQGQGALRLMIVARDDSALRSPRDLVGKSFAFGDPAAILQRAVVVHSGIRLEELGGYKFIGHYDNIARGVANGDFDAGILKDSTAEAWSRKGLRIIHTSPALPPYNIAVSGHTPEALENRIRAALLRLNIARPDQAEVIRALDSQYTGFAAVSDGEYDIVRTLVQPFQQ